MSALAAPNVFVESARLKIPYLWRHPALKLRLIEGPEKNSAWALGQILTVGRVATEFGITSDDLLMHIRGGFIHWGWYTFEVIDVSHSSYVPEVHEQRPGNTNPDGYGTRRVVCITLLLVAMGLAAYSFHLLHN